MMVKKKKKKKRTSYIFLGPYSLGLPGKACHRFISDTKNMTDSKDWGGKIIVVDC